MYILILKMFTLTKEMVILTKGFGHEKHKLLLIETF
jgi:hypothetical protein